MVVLFWLVLWESFLFGHTRVWTQDLWISSSALYHCAMVTFGFQLWQFHVFYSGAEGLVVVLFWLHLWEIFFLATLGFEPGTSGSLVLHSTTAPWWLLVFTFDNFRYLTLVQRDWWWYCSDWTCEDFLFGHTWVWTWDFWISSPALYHCATVTSGFTSDNFKYLTLVQRDWWWYCSDWSCERFSFCPHWGLNPGPQDL